MDQGPLSRRILEEFDSLSPQMKAAARFIVDNPDDVALLTMREQSRRAKVLPATMTRLAQRLGYDGFDAIRELYVSAIRAGDLGFAGRAGRQLAEQRSRGDTALAEDHLAAAAAALAELRQPAMLERLGQAAETLATASRLFCLGLRASFPLAWTANYLLGLVDDRAVLLDDAGALLADHARAAREGDALLVFGFDPYTRATVETARRLTERGVEAVAVTDSPVSPLARIARHAICVGGGESPAFFRSMTPAFAVAEILAALIAGKRGDVALAALGQTEAHLSASQVHWVDRES